MGCTDKEKIENLLKKLWKEDDGSASIKRISYDKALQDVQCEIDAQVKDADANNLSTYTTEQLKAEIRRRIEAAKAEREKVARCRNCVHMVTEKKWWYENTKCKVHTYMRHGEETMKCVKPCWKACDKYKRKEELV